MNLATDPKRKTAPAEPGHNHPRNSGIAFNEEAVLGPTVNLSAVERRTSSLPARRSVKKEYQAAWLVKAIQCIDLTTLAGVTRRRSARSASTRPW
jgi:deoxyribose-phosphate aldolase